MYSTVLAVGISRKMPILAGPMIGEANPGTSYGNPDGQA